MAVCEPEGYTKERLHKISKSTRHGVGIIEIEPCDPVISPTSEWDDQDISSDDRKSTFSKSDVHHMYQSFPFGFRTPENCSSSVCRWIFPITFGGGLVGGDQIEAKISIGQRCCVLICTQEITKVFHCLQTTETTTQCFDYTLKEHSLLCVLPDPLVCYRDARFKQKQKFHVCPSSNLLFLDWLQSGREALGESWNFQRYCSTIEMFFCDKFVLRECNDMESTELVDLGKAMGTFKVLGTCIILGPYLHFLSRMIEERFARKKGFGEKQSKDLVVSVSPLSYNVGGNEICGSYIRFMATDINAKSHQVWNCDETGLWFCPTSLKFVAKKEERHLVARCSPSKEDISTMVCISTKEQVRRSIPGHRILTSDAMMKEKKDKK